MISAASHKNQFLISVINNVRSFYIIRTHIGCLYCSKCNIIKGIESRDRRNGGKKIED